MDDRRRLSDDDLDALVVDLGSGIDACCGFVSFSGGLSSDALVDIVDTESRESTEGDRRGRLVGLSISSSSSLLSRVSLLSLCPLDAAFGSSVLTCRVSLHHHKVTTLTYFLTFSSSLVSVNAGFNFGFRNCWVREALLT